MDRADGKGIDPELLAALIDGQVPEPRRTALLARLSPDDLALVADVAAVRGETPGVLPIAAAPRRRWRARHLGVLAIAAGIIGVTTLSLVQREAAREQGLPPDLAFSFPLWHDATRGALVPIDSVALSWRIGTRLADVDAAIAARDSVNVAKFAGELAALLTAANAGISAPIYRRMADSAALPRERLEQLAGDGRAGLTRRVDPRLVSLAQWMESTRIAAYMDTAGIRGRSPENDRRLADLALVNPQAASTIRNAIATGDWHTLRLTVAATLDTLGR